MSHSEKEGIGSEVSNGTAQPPAPGRRGFLRRAGLFLCLVLAFSAGTIFLQWRAGVYQAELNGYPDEAAHLITGLMVRDYLVTGIGQSPVKFAENYYLHYPKVGFGIWPPLFHFVEAAWFLVTPPGKTSAFVLQGVITGTLAACVTWMALSFGWVIALMAGLALICMPTVQSFTGMVMADNLMCLISFLAMFAFAKYGESWSRRYLYLFGLLAGLALMTKSNAAGLALLPVVALLLLGHLRRLISWPMILAGLVALLVAGPWQMLVIRLWTNATSTSHYSAAYVLEMLRVHTSMYYNMPGVVVFALAAAGIAYTVVIPYRKGTLEPGWAALTGLVLGMFLFGLAPLPPEPRYHVASMAGLAVFAAAGLWLLQREARTRFGQPAGLGVLLGVATLYGVTTFSMEHRLPLGYNEVAKRLSGDPSYKDAVILVSSENMGEGLLISEMAPLEQRPSHYILRATKMLSRSRWNLDKYELLYPEPAQMQEFFESIPVRLLVYDTARGIAKMQHHDVLAAMLKQYQDKWMKIGTYPAAGPNPLGGRIEIYELKGAAEKMKKRISIDMKYTLQRTLD